MGPTCKREKGRKYREHNRGNGSGGLHSTATTDGGERTGGKGKMSSQRHGGPRGGGVVARTTMRRRRQPNEGARGERRNTAGGLGRPERRGNGGHSQRRGVVATTRYGVKEAPRRRGNKRGGSGARGDTLKMARNSPERVRNGVVQSDLGKKEATAGSQGRRGEHCIECGEVTSMTMTAQAEEQERRGNRWWLHN